MVITSFPPAYSGAAQALIKLGKGLIQRGHKISVVCALPAGAASYEEIEGIQVYRLYSGLYDDMSEVPTFSNQAKFALASAWFIWKHRNVFDVIHFHGIGRNSVGAILVAKLVGIPTIGKVSGIEHDSPSAHLKRRFGKMLLKILGLVDAFIAVSPRIASDILSFSSWNSSKIFQIPNPIDCNIYTHIDSKTRLLIRSKMGIAADEFIFLFVGAICKGKGIDALVDAWCVVRQKAGTSVKLLAIGPPWEDSMVKLLIDRVGIDYSGYKTIDEVRDIYAAADAFVLPTRGEGLPNAVLEAMASGLPCIVGRLEGITDYLLGEERGILINPEDNIDLANAMLKIYEHPTVAKEMANKAKKWVVENANMKPVVMQYEAIYGNLFYKKLFKNG